MCNTSTMLKSIYETNDEEYREFIIGYVLRYHGADLLTDEEKHLLKPTNHFGPQFDPEDIMNFLNGSTEEDGCCGGAHKENRACISKDADKIEKKYKLHLVKMPEGDSYDYWRCLGWVNFNFKAARMANAFRIQCVERLLKNHCEVIFKNKCPTCGRLRRTPKAKICMW